MVSTSRTPDRAGAIHALSVAFLGNMLQWYDFAVFSYFAIVLGKVFSSGETTEVEALMNSFLIYGVGFLGRPLGGLFFGHLGDTYGRKFLLMLTIFLMAAGTLLMGFAPGYESIGLWAPALLIIGRLLQGLSVGGEWSAATIYMVEWAPRGYRGLWGSFQQASIAAGFLVASLTAAICTSYMAPMTLETWGWRIPFLLGGFLLAPFALYMRTQVEETPVFKEAMAKEKAEKAAAATKEHVVAAAPEAPSARVHSSIIAAAIRTIAIASCWVGSYYVFFTYTSNWAVTYTSVPAGSALWANTIGVFTFMMLIPFMGWMSDLFGRKPVLLVAGVCTLCFPYFMYSFLFDVHATFWQLVLIQMGFAVLASLFSGPGPTTLSEIFPTKQRSTWMAPAYSSATALAAGFAPALSIWLIDTFNNPAVHTFYICGLAILAISAVVGMRETAFDTTL